MIDRRLFLGLAGLVMAAGCVPSVAGWDVASLLEAEPQVAAISGQRLGDMTPHPALSSGAILLVACRYADDLRSGPVSVGVTGSGPGWPGEWAALAIRTVDDAIPEVDLELLRDTESEVSLPRRIEIVSVEDPLAELPNGMADTLSECDVSTTGPPGGRIRGELVHSEIRIRHLREDNARRVRSASDAEWIGALMHELGHALGFVGHAAVGDSLVLLEESRLRAFGRRALAGEPVPAPNVRALYAIDPGRVLGRVEVSAEGRAWIDAVQAFVVERSAMLGPPIGPLASAGDQEARLVWRWAGGLEVALRFPYWRREIRKARPMTVWPTQATRRALARAS